MGLIKKSTIERIWQCYREIEASENLLNDFDEIQKTKNDEPLAQHLKDAFGRMTDFQLGVPSGKSGHRIFGLSSELAKSVITAHKSKKEYELTEAMEQARIELGE